MSIKLKREKNEFDLDNISWAIVLNLAEAYGWKPEGTDKPKGYGVFKKWPGNYDSSDNQMVKQTDAIALAEALYVCIKDDNAANRYKVIVDKIEKAIEQSIGKKLDFQIERNIDKVFMKKLSDYIHMGQFYIN